MRTMIFLALLMPLCLAAPFTGIVNHEHSDVLQVEFNEQLRLLFKIIDIDQDGRIDAEEFILIGLENNLDIPATEAERAVTIHGILNIDKFVELLADCPSNETADILLYLIHAGGSGDRREKILGFFNHWKTRFMEEMMKTAPKLFDNGKIDCIDGSDEKSFNIFKCSSGECLREERRCNGEEECEDGSDEKDCEYYGICLELYEKEEDAKAFTRFKYNTVMPECWEDIQPQFNLSTQTKSKSCTIADAKTELFHLKSCEALNELKAMGSLRKIVFIVHGYTSDATSWEKDMADQIIEHDEDVAVVTVDWRKGAQGDFTSFTEDGFNNYNQAAANTRYVGVAIARIIDQLRILKPKAIHCIGHSLGAHACGFAGKFPEGLVAVPLVSFRGGLGDQTQKKETSIDRISGLDPAGRNFYEASEEERLDKGDANRVDILHTDGNWLGLMKPIGHIDFYAGIDGKMDNYYGTFQAGCAIPYNVNVSPLSQDPMSQIGKVCNHLRSHEIYKATISSGGSCTPKVKCLKSTSKTPTSSGSLTECEDWNKEPGYGYWYDGEFTGLYGFIARKEEPYCRQLALSNRWTERWMKKAMLHR